MRELTGKRIGKLGWKPRDSAIPPTTQNGTDRAKTSKKKRSGERPERALVINWLLRDEPMSEEGTTLRFTFWI